MRLITMMQFLVKKEEEEEECLGWRHYNKAIDGRKGKYCYIFKLRLSHLNQAHSSCTYGLPRNRSEEDIRGI